MATLQRYVPMGIQNPNAAQVQTFPEAASQTFKEGDWVTLSSGKVSVGVAAGNNFGSGDKLLGMALQDASGTTDTDIRVYVFKGGTVQRLPVYHATPASAVTAVAGNGVAYEIRNHTGSIPCVDIGSTSNTKGQQVCVAKQYPVGEQYGLIDFTFTGAQCIFPGGFGG